VLGEVSVDALWRIPLSIALVVEPVFLEEGSLQCRAMQSVVSVLGCPFGPAFGIEYLLRARNGAFHVRVYSLSFMCRVWSYCEVMLTGSRAGFY
jgi:hypothetical protein